MREQSGDPAVGENRGAASTGRLTADPATVEQGLPNLVLSLVELLR
jgi:hypothetical protein